VRRIGLLGGTFDPVHNGHVKLAEGASEALGLDEVWLVPARRQPLKQEPASPAEIRLEMCRLAAAEHGFLGVCDVELARGGPSYTVDTLEELTASHPGVEWTFLAGTDALLDLPRWRDPGRLLSLCRFAVVERSGVTWEELMRHLPKHLASRLLRLPVEALEVSSTDIRARAGRGEPVSGLVPTVVERFIEQHHLYRREGA
jgi:nicotinate-nucleotide adenylyltransferase